MMMSACGKQPAVAETEGGVAELSITVRTSEITKAAGAASGDALNNLRLWIVDANKNIVKFVKTDDWQTFSGTMEGTEATFDAGRKTATIRFSDIYRATYTLYAVANYTELDGYDGYAGAKKIDSAFIDKELPEMADYQTPSYSNEVGMPLSVSKTIQLLPGENKISAELERVLAHFSIKIKNQSDGHKIVIGDASLSDFNMSRTYLFPHQDDSKMPADCEDLQMPPFGNLPLSLGSGIIETVYSTYLYGGESKSGYKLRMAVGAFPEGQDVSGLKAEGAVKIVEDGHEVKADGTEYMIRSCYGTSYDGYPCLYLTDAKALGVKALTDAQIKAMTEEQLKPYLWTFTDEDEGYVRSAYNPDYHLNSRNSRLEASQSQKTEFMFDFREAKPDRMYFMAGGKGVYLGYSYYQGYYVSTNGSSSILDTSGDQYFWKLLPLSDVKWSDGTKTVDAAGSTFIARDLTSFDEYNVPQPLTALWRNQRLTTTITVTFMSQTGAFDYVVEDWKEGGGSASFN